MILYTILKYEAYYNFVAYFHNDGKVGVIYNVLPYFQIYKLSLKYIKITQPTHPTNPRC